MTLVCAPILAGDAGAALAMAEQARRAGADLVEYRVDHIFHGEGDGAGADAVLRIVRESPLPCIVTCRPTSEGGDYDGDDAARIALCERLGAMGAPGSREGPHGPRYIDVELSTLDRSANLRQKVRLAVHHPDQPRDLSTSLILSMHDFKGRPADLLQRLERMRNEPAAKVLKVAIMARSPRDNLELFDLLTERDRPTIAIAMGPSGLMSRVLAPKFGGFLTFASVREPTVTAPGQPTIAELLERYRFRGVNPRTRLYGVIGWPVEHSLSPIVHNAGFAALDPDGRGHDGVYLPLPVAPEWPSFKATVGALADHPRLDFSGASVTIPHKEHLVRLARERAGEGWSIDPVADRAGAANTLVRTAPDRWRVTNTDAGAIIACLRSALGPDLRARRVAILGGGGVARAALAALTAERAEVVIHARRGEQAHALAEEFSVRAAPWDERAETKADAWINCTPIGMSTGPDADATPLDDAALGRFPESTVVMDTVYTPRNTPLLKAARARSLRAIDGMELFVRQAEEQFRLWTGSMPAPGLFTSLVESSGP